jgi:hypothetical protein
MASKKTPTASKKTTVKKTAPVRGTKPTLVADNEKPPRTITTQDELLKWLKKGYMVLVEDETMKKMNVLYLVYRDSLHESSVVTYEAYFKIILGEGLNAVVPKVPLTQRRLLTAGFGEGMYLVHSDPKASEQWGNRDADWAYYRELETAHTKEHKKSITMDEAAKITTLTWIEVKQRDAVNRMMLTLSGPKYLTKNKTGMFFEVFDTTDGEEFPITTVDAKDIVRVLTTSVLIPTILWKPHVDAANLPSPPPKVPTVSTPSNPEKGGEVARRPQLRDLHNAVREALAPFKFEVDGTPRQPKRIGNQIHYYLNFDPKKARRSEGQKLQSPLIKATKQWVSDIWIAYDSTNWPFKVVATVRPEMLGDTSKQNTKVA